MARLNLTALSAFILWLASAASHAAAPVPQAFLLQNSGWMEPFYADPNSALKPLVTAIIEAVTYPNETYFVSAFSQSTADNPSPRLLYPNPQQIPLRQAVAALELAHKNNTSPVLADTDFQEAVLTTIEQHFQRKPGIIWIFTNNRNSPNNDQDTVRRNQEFYTLLHSEASIARSLVYNLAMPVKGKVYPQARGLMIYALAYGAAADAKLRELSSSPRLKNILTALPARLKPLDSESVRLVPTEIINAPAVKISVAADRRTTVLEVDASDKQPSVTVKAEMENLFYPYQIDRAQIAAAFSSGSSTYPLQVTPATLDILPAGASHTVSVQFPIPHTQIPSVWSWALLKQLGTQLHIPGEIIIQLSGQQLSLDPNFIADLQKNFPGDPISAVYAPAKEAQNSSVAVPVQIRVNYPVYPLIILGGLGLLLLIATVLALLGLSRAKTVEILADGVSLKPRLKPFQSQPIHNERGELIGEITRGLLNAKITRVLSGHSLRLK